MPESEPPVSLALHAMGIAHRVFRHPGPVSSLDQAARERGQRPSQVVRSIVFRLGADRFAMVLAAGPDQIDWKALRQSLGQSRLTMATESEVLTVTGYVTGSVSPFGLPAPLLVYVDESVLAEDDVSIGSGVRGVTVILSSTDLMRALQLAHGPDLVKTGRFRAGPAS